MEKTVGAFSSTKTVKWDRVSVCSAVQSVLERTLKDICFSLLYYLEVLDQGRTPSGKSARSTVERVFFRTSVDAFVVVFLAEMGRIPYYGRPESSSSNI